MKEKIFVLRVDVESPYCFEKMDKFLDLLKKLEVKVSFYCVMGFPSAFGRIGEFFTKGSNYTLIQKDEYWEDLVFQEKFPYNPINLRYSLKEKIELFSSKFKLEDYKDILKRMKVEGHEVGLHGFVHFAWMKKLDSLDLEKEIGNAVRKYEEIFGEKPISWTSPGFKIRKSVVYWLEKFGIKYVSDLDGKQPFKIKLLEFESNIINIPITITGENKTPLIEFLSAKGYSDKEVVEKIIEKLEENDTFLKSMYVHGMFEVRKKIKVLEEILKFVKDGNFRIKKISEFKV